MAPSTKPIRSEIAWSTSDRIIVRGKDLCDEIIGHYDLGAFAYLHVVGRAPDPVQARLFNAILVTLSEHGVTPSVIAARMTYFGAPEAMQAAVAAGLCGLGSVFVGSTEGAARMLYDGLGQSGSADNPDVRAEAVVAAFRARGEAIPGLGHPIHKEADPRTARLFALGRELGYSGRYVTLMRHIADAAARASRRTLPINATGAVGALCCELGLPWQMVRGIGVMARAVGLVGHILEEARAPIAPEIWRRTEEEASAHRRSGEGDGD